MFRYTNPYLDKEDTKGRGADTAGAAEETAVLEKQRLV